MLTYPRGYYKKGNTCQHHMKEKDHVCENILISRDFGTVSRKYLFSRTYSMCATEADTGRSGEKFPIFAKF
jgi:hypothetical protein